MVLALGSSTGSILHLPLQVAAAAALEAMCQSSKGENWARGFSLENSPRVLPHHKSMSGSKISVRSLPDLRERESLEDSKKICSETGKDRKIEKAELKQTVGKQIESEVCEAERKLSGQNSQKAVLRKCRRHRGAETSEMKR